jgi:hypothetical protein
VTTIKNATLGPTGGNNIKMNKNGAVLNLSNVKVEGQRADATNNTNGIMVEGGSVFGENIQIYNTNANGIRCKLGKVDIKNVQLDNIGQAGISCSKMVKDKVELGVGEVVLQDFTIGKVGTKSIDIVALNDFYFAFARENLCRFGPVGNELSVINGHFAPFTRIACEF